MVKYGIMSRKCWYDALQQLDLLLSLPPQALSKLTISFLSIYDKTLVPIRSAESAYMKLNNIFLNQQSTWLVYDSINYCSIIKQSNNNNIIKRKNGGVRIVLIRKHDNFL